MKTLELELQKIKSNNLYREMKIISSSPEREIIIDGKSYLNFSSNNYLGLATHPVVKKAAIEAIEKYGVGGVSSRLVGGNLDLHEELENKLADFKKTDRCLVFPSGFQTNIGIISTILSDGDCIIMDRLTHASLWDGAKLSKARIFVYPHLDMDFLKRILKRTAKYRRRLIVTDSVFSMDGDFANLAEIVFLAEKYDAWTMIDEAHATGIFGNHGRGLAEHFGVEDKISIIMGTLSKAIGSQGGFICGSNNLINYVINRCRSFIYTTALSPVCAAASIAALEVIKNEPERRFHLLENSKFLRDSLESRNFNIQHSQSQIIPITIGTAVNTIKLSSKLFDNGIFAPAIRPPTVPENECRIRLSLTSQHSRENIEHFLTLIG